MPSRVVLGLISLSLLVAAGCGDDDDPAGGAGKPAPAATVDTAAVEQGIKQDLSTASVKITSVKCPSDVEQKPGGTFTCTLKLSNGGTGKAKVTMAGGNNYTYELKPGSVTIPGETADAAIEKSLAAQGAPNALVNCPDTIKVKVGTTVSCAVSSAGGADGTVTYTFSSEDGTVDPESVETP